MLILEGIFLTNALAIDTNHMPPPLLRPPLEICPPAPQYCHLQFPSASVISLLAVPFSVSHLSHCDKSVALRDCEEARPPVK